MKTMFAKTRMFTLILFIVGIFLFAPQFASASLVHYYDFEDGTGTTLSDTVGSVNITYNAVSWDSAEYPIYNISGNGTDYSMEHDASTVYGSVNTDVITSDANYSVCVWIKPDNVASQDVIFSTLEKYDEGGKKEDFLMQVASSQIQVHKRTADNDADTDRVEYGISNGNWYHICFVYDSSLGLSSGNYLDGSMNLYVDSVLRDSVITDSALVGWTGDETRIGYATATVEFDGNIDEVRIYNTALSNTEVQNLYYYGNISGLSSPPTTPNASDHKTETTTLQQQTTNVTLNSIAYTTIYSYSFTPANETQFYQSFTIPVNPTASNTLTCKVQLDGADLGLEHSRTNTAGQIGQILLKTTNTTIDTTSHTIDLLCKRTGGGSMVLFDIVGVGHLLFDQASGDTIPYYIDTFTNSTTSGSTLVPIHTDSHTTANSNLTDMEHHIVLEYTATITNNGGSAETVYLIPSFGSYNCTETIRYVGAGASGSVGGICTIKNVTGNTAYTHKFYANGTNVQYAITYDTKELYLHDEDIDNAQIDWTNSGNTGWFQVLGSTLNADQDLGAGQDIFNAIGISHIGTGSVQYQTRLSGDDTENSTTFERIANSNFGVLGVHWVYNNLATGNYTQKLYAYADDLTRIVGEFVAYETGKQTTTTNTFSITANDTFLDTSLSSFTVSVNGNNYTTTTGTITIPKQGLANLTYYATNYNSISYTNINTSATSHQGQLCQVYVTGGTPTDIQGTSISYPYNLTINGTLVTHTDATTQSCTQLNVAHDITFSKTNYWNKTTTKNYTSSGTETYIPINISNAWIKFYGATSGTQYTPSCTMNGSTLKKDQTYFYAVVNNAQLQCLEGTYYLPFNQTVNTSTLPLNTSYAITEYTVTLNFSTNVNGTIAWSGLTDGQYNLATDAGYNITEAKWVKLTKNFTDDDYVVVRFNNQSNNTNQYYEWIADTDAIINEEINVLTTLDMFLRFKVFNFAEEQLYGATIRLRHCPDATFTNCKVVNQRITQPISGTANDGTAISIDDDLIYWATITKEGYQTKDIVFNAQDLDNQFIFEVHLNTIPFSYDGGYQLVCPETHFNNSQVICSISGTSGTIAWGTDINGQQTPITLQTGGTSITLTGGVDYNNASNVTITLYQPDGSGGYTTITTKTVTYLAIPQTTLYISEDNATSMSTAILWVMIILIASIVGFSIRKDEIDTGYYVFAGGLLIVSIFYPTLMIVSAIVVLTGIGNLLFASTRE